MLEPLKNIISFLKAAEANGNLPGWLANEWVLILTTIVLLTTVGNALWKGFTWLRTWQRRRWLNRDLAPFFTRQEIYQATKYYIPTHYQNVAPSEDDEPGRSYIASARNKLIPLFLNKAFLDRGDDNKYYLLLADAGMGKTTFMINLYIAYKRQWQWWKKRYDIKLLPLGHPHAMQELDNIPDDQKKDTILLLDALDEDAEAVKQYEKRLPEILDRAWRFREIVITCRTQFFPSKAEEPTETGYVKLGGAGGEYKFQKLYVSVFDDRDIKRYLRKRFPVLNPFAFKKRQKAKKIVRKSPNLMVRPMLLSRIEDLLATKKDFQYTYEIYEALIDKWLNREASKPGIKQKYGSKERFKEQLLQFSQSLALDLYREQEKRGGFFIHKDEKISTPSDLQLDDLEEDLQEALRESEWRTRSLLNRNAEGYYKFSHKSILEYFLAKEAIENEAFTLDIEFEGLDTAELFCEEMLWGVVLADINRTHPLGLSSKTRILPDLGYIKKLETLEVSVTAEVNILALRFSDKSLRRVLVKHNREGSFLYALYSLFVTIKLLELESLKKYQELEKLIKKLKEQLFPEIRQLLEMQELIDVKQRLDEIEQFDLLNFKGVRELLSLTTFLDLQELQDLIEASKVQGYLDQRRLLIMRGRLEIFQRKEQVKRLDILKGKDPQTLQQLRQANEFIKKCQALQKAMPDTEIIY